MNSSRYMYLGLHKSLFSVIGAISVLTKYFLVFLLGKAILSNYCILKLKMSLNHFTFSSGAICFLAYCYIFGTRSN